MLEKAKTSATRKDEHGLARMVFEGVDLTPDDAGGSGSGQRVQRAVARASASLAAALALAPIFTELRAGIGA